MSDMSKMQKGYADSSLEALFQRDGLPNVVGTCGAGKHPCIVAIDLPVTREGL